jgi:hypothetical protein
MEGPTKLNYAIKNLRRKWDELSPHWQDAVKDDFEARHIDPLSTQVNATIRGMNLLEEVLIKMRRDCS